MSVMSDAYGTQPAVEPREREVISQRRRKAKGRLSRERARNTRLAIAGVVLRVVVICVGVRVSFGPINLGSLGGSKKLDAATARFLATHVGNLLFSAPDGVMCHQVEFNNDTGVLTDGAAM